MKRLFIIMVALVCAAAVSAGEYTYTFRDTPVSEAIVRLLKDHPEANVAFIYGELDRYRTSATIDTDDLGAALRSIIGFHPINLSTRKGVYYVEALQHGKYTYTGRVVDAEGEPLSGASVLLITPKDSVVVTYGTTAHDGTFSIPCDRRNLTAKASCVGYLTDYKRAAGYTVGTITLRENPIALRSITVAGDAVVLEPDKNTYVPSQRQKQHSATGLDLLKHMAIPTLVTTPGSSTVTDVFGNICEIFVNYSPASDDDLNALMIANVRKVEVYDSPTDPRFRGARKAINIIVQEYVYGGYTKVAAAETVLNGFRNKANIYNKFTYKRMTYDLYVGANNNRNKNIGTDTRSQYTLAEGVATRDENTTASREIRNSVPVTFRAALNTNRLQLQNQVSYAHESCPEQSYSGHLTLGKSPAEEYSFTRANSSRLNSLNYNGSLYWWHPRDFAIDYSQMLSYDHRNNASLYRTDAMAASINNDAVEDRTYLRLNLYGMKAFGSRHRLRLGGRFIYLNDKVVYPGNAGISDLLKTASGSVTSQYTLSTKDINLSANAGLGFEKITAGSVARFETSPFGDINVAWKINKRNSISAYAWYGVWTPGVEMRQDAVIRDNEYLYLTGNASLENYRELKTNIAYNLYPRNNFNLAAFAGYNETFDRVATVYAPYGDDALIRSFVNDGNYSNLYVGASANLKLFNNSLQLYANITQRFIRTTGIYDASYNPLRIQLQAAYYWRSLYALAAWSSGNSTLTENSNITIRSRNTYVFEAGWGNGAWVLSLSAKNIFRYRWDSETWTRPAPLYHEHKTLYSPSAHAALTLSVTYTIGYGKRTRPSNEVAPAPASSTAIIQP